MAVWPNCLSHTKVHHPGYILRPPVGQDLLVPGNRRKSKGKTLVIWRFNCHKGNEHLAEIVKEDNQET